MSYRHSRRSIRDEPQSSPVAATLVCRLSDASENDGETCAESAANPSGLPENDIAIMVKNFVRLALACEQTRSSIRREEISKKVPINNHRRYFPQVFDRTQERLRNTFGMELIELPVKDRTRNMTMTQQRKLAHTHASASHVLASSKAGKSWILRNILPPNLKQISQRQHIELERNYNAVAMIICIIVVMSDNQCSSESRLISALERLGWSPKCPAGPLDEVITKMTKQGYIDRLKDDQSMDGTFTLHIGPRGKLETLHNRDELKRLLMQIYGSNDDAEAQERLGKIIQDTLDGDEDDVAEASDEDDPEALERSQDQVDRKAHKRHKGRAT